jgi:serine/threonine protein kinase
LNHMTMTDNLTSAATKMDWTSLAGIILDGGCELKDATEVRDNAAKLRVRILGSGGRMGTAYFLRLEPKDADDQLDIWETLREIQHPNLNRPLSVGRRQVSGVDTIYFVLADPDEKLAAVVPERPLEWEEAAEALHSLEKALAHLHSFGLIHGSVSPDTVQAVGYTIQLDTEDVRRLGTKPRIVWNKPRYLAPESGTANTTTAADVWCLGATLFEVLAQEPYGTPGAELEEGLPLGGIISRCLEKNPATRCTLKEAPVLEKQAPAEPELVKPQLAQPEPPKPEQLQAETAKAEAAQSETPVAAPVEPQTPPRLEPQVFSAPETAPPANKTTNGTAAQSKPATADRPAQPTPPRPLDQRIPGSRPPAGTRIAHPIAHHPLTPKPSPRQITKEDMALVPVGKRHKKVQGKRQGVGARIRTLDGPSRDFQEEEAVSRGPVARILAVGKGANFLRGFIAASLLMLLFIAAVWFIIIPKLQTPLESVAKGDSLQTAPPPFQTGSLGASAAPGQVSPAQLPGVLPPLTAPASSAGAPSDTSSSSAAAETQPFVRVKPERFRVVLSTADTRADAIQRLEKLSQQHPELFLQVMPTRSNTGDRRYLVVAGGSLSRNEADQLRQRILGKGLKTVEIVPYRP